MTALWLRSGRALATGCALLAGCALLTGCAGEPDRAPAIGSAYTGPASLNLRREIAPNSGTVATVNHGTRLEIVQQRRRFVQVRTAAGVEGWTEERMLLRAPEMEALRRVTEMARKLPSQGIATAFDTLNVHTEPHRLSPSFYQAHEGEKFEAIWHRVALRRAPQRPPLIPPAPKPAPVAKKKSAPEPALPKPAAPEPPDEWERLSKSPVAKEKEPVSASRSTPGKGAVPEPEPADDWSLVRMSTGQSGWVLTRRLFMAIPDEVAQYAEGKRITSYFPLAGVQDGGTTKHHWLWTTMNEGLQPYQFDSFRVFIWSLKRQRFETAYIERNLKGYYPTLLHTVTMPSGESFPGSRCAWRRKTATCTAEAMRCW
jgi:hypothetical protein